MAGQAAREGGASCDEPACLPAAARAGPLSHAIIRLGRLHRMVAGQLLRQAGLHPGQELLMMHLWEAGPLRQADLVRVLDSDAATVTRKIQRLEQAGFVRRFPCPDDRRAAYIEPTPASQALRGRVERIWQQLEEITVRGLDEPDRQAAQRLLERLAHNLASAACATDPPG